MKNEVADFFEQGKSFSSEEGWELIKSSDYSVINEAIKDPQIAEALIIALDKNPDPYFRRNILLAFCD